MTIFVGHHTLESANGRTVNRAELDASSCKGLPRVPRERAFKRDAAPILSGRDSGGDCKNALGSNEDRRLRFCRCMNGNTQERREEHRRAHARVAVGIRLVG